MYHAGKTVIRTLMKYYGGMCEIETVSGTQVLGCLTDMNMQTATVEIITMDGETATLGWGEIRAIGRPGSGQKGP